MTQQFLFAFGITGPVLILLLLGVLMRRLSLIDDGFIQAGNKVVFNVSLPIMLFFSTATQSLSSSLNVSLAIFASVATIISVILLKSSAPFLVRKEKIGVFVQGAFRGNLGIVGIALVLNAYGAQALSSAGVYIAFVTLLYNVASIWLLGLGRGSYIRTMLRNPLIIGILLGLFVSWRELMMPFFLRSTGQYLSGLTLPLALICIGGSLRWTSIKLNHKDVLWATLFKLILLPVTFTIAGFVWGFRGQELGILCLMSAAPTAASSYIMAKQMTAYGDMAAEIVAMTTIGSVLSITLGLMVLNALSVI